MKEILKERVIHLLDYLEALNEKVESEAARINKNAQVMSEEVHKSGNVSDELFNNYKFDRVLYSLYEGEVFKTFFRIAEVYKLCLIEGVVFQDKYKKRLDNIFKEEEEQQFFIFENGEIRYKDGTIKGLIEKGILEKDNSVLKKQFMESVKNNLVDENDFSKSAPSIETLTKEEEVSEEMKE